MVTFLRIVVLFLPSLIYAWGANGHVLISHLAYQFLSPESKMWLHQELSRSKKPPQPSDLSRASIWMDQVRGRGYRALARLHYIDLPSGEAQYFTKLAPKNAVTALVLAEQELKSKQTSASRTRFQLKLILHVIADLHQPMHSINYFSSKFPQGDHGGNLYLIHQASYRGNLHHFWDDGGGWLKNFSWKDKKALAAKLHAFYGQGCEEDNVKLDPYLWAKDSFQLAKKYAYFPPEDEKQFVFYQARVQALTQQQILKSACHLAAYINHLSASRGKLS